MYMRIGGTSERRGWSRIAMAAMAIALMLAPRGLAAQESTASVVATDTAEMRLVVNIPAFRLDVYRGDAIVRTFRVTVGRSGYETPTGSFEIPNVIFNPWWRPPQSPWAAGRTPEAPGPRNPMGRAKLNFGPLLYIHGTTNLAALGGTGSHGCVRMANEDVLELARLVQEYGAPEAGAQVPALIANPTRTRQITLQRTVRLEIRYDVAEVRDGRLELHADVYGLSRPAATRAEAVLALMRAGIDPRTVDSERLQQFATASGNPRRSVALTELMATPVVATALP